MGPTETTAPEIEAIKRRAYLASLPLGALACTVVWLIEHSRSTLHAVDGVGLPLLVATMLGITAVLLRRRRGLRPLELLLLGSVTAYMLAVQAFAVVAEHPAREPLGDLVAVGQWFPVVFVLAFVMLGPSLGGRVAATFFLASLLAGAGHFWRGLEPSAYYALVLVFAGNGLTLLLLAAFARIHGWQARRAAEMEVKALTDPLTGLPNRRGIEERLAQSLAGSAPVTLILFDLDRFKRVNDELGHDVGDDLLRRLGELLRDHLRRSDLIGRWGGEEFVMLSTGLTREEAVAAAERLRRAVAAADVGQAGSITASFGVALSRPGDRADALVARADAALYAAKRAGRNRVEEAQEAPAA